MLSKRQAIDPIDTENQYLPVTAQMALLSTTLINCSQRCKPQVRAVTRESRTWPGIQRQWLRCPLFVTSPGVERTRSR